MEKKEILKLFNLYSHEMYKLTPEMKEIIELRNNDIEKLRPTLTDEQRKLLDNIINLESDERATENRQIFVFAFSLATRLFTEGLGKKD